MLTENQLLQLEALNQLVTDGLASGEVLPLPVTVFNRGEIEEAFRYLASGHSLKLVIPCPHTLFL